MNNEKPLNSHIMHVDFLSKNNTDEGLKNFIRANIEEGNFSKSDIERAFIDACTFGRIKTAQYLLLSNVGFSQNAINSGIIMSLINNHVETLDEIKKNSSFENLDFKHLLNKEDAINQDEILDKIDNMDNFNEDQQKQLFQDLLHDSSEDISLDKFIRDTYKSANNSISITSFDRESLEKIDVSLLGFSKAASDNSNHKNHIISELLKSSEKEVNKIKELFTEALIDKKSELQDIKTEIDKTISILDDKNSLFSSDELLTYDAENKDKILKDLNFYSALLDDVMENIEKEKRFTQNLASKIDAHHSSKLDIEDSAPDVSSKIKDLSNMVNEISKSEYMPSETESFIMLDQIREITNSVTSSKIKELAYRIENMVASGNSAMAFVNIAQLSSLLNENSNSTQSIEVKKAKTLVTSDTNENTVDSSLQYTQENYR